ncbi:twin-arginine translocase subunit TatC [Viridibacillus sp. FSL R5-0477]|uniref:Sec-independent protein translocase protein TatC n=1 Tax=Viridibacillus arenosi FSL R5-213 TaxID=1227360 RepID=W4F3N5_9BACL|nr:MULTISPECIES: twin-arginine translocase subunit TatC [Viridibacillus]ETT87380.1 Sec-independent protein translocase TatCD [Viridibacillus arenosi FSL R5-213]OMC87802.1 twin arginine-targeting protein translocase TatC [Viridibacillus sp. FSL H7-0596]OMC91350.1 twin arginine-targeting protein translocase TatC [Viridibacillus arenosi]
MDPYEENGKKVLSPLDLISSDENETPETTEDASVENREPSPTPPEENEEEKGSLVNESLVAHLADLRKQIIKGVTIFVIFFIIVFATVNKWLPYVTRGHDLVILGPLEVVKFYMSVSTTIALGLSLPFLMHFIWQFVKPGLKENESRFLGLYSPVMLLLFLVGVSFGYFIINPLSYQFLIGIGESNFNVMISASEYIHYLIMTTVPIGLLFELPIIAMFLSTIGILTAYTMKSIRKWSYVFMAVFSALITPPDFMSQLLVLIPMILLYEISIHLVKRIEDKKALKASLENVD